MKNKKFKFTTLLFQIVGCNHSCKHCYMPYGEYRYIPLSEAKQIIDNYAQVYNPPSIAEEARIYIHNEPTIYPELVELLDYAGSNKIVPVPVVSTNGVGIARRDNWKDIIKTFKTHGVKGLNMSLFGESKYHDEFTGCKDSFRDTLEAARRAKSQELKVHWNLYVFKDNVDQVVHLIEQLPDDSKDICTPSYAENWEKHRNIHPTMKEINEIPADIIDKYSYWSKRNEYKCSQDKSEAQWVEICSQGDQWKEYLDPDWGYESFSLMNLDDDLYDYEVFKPLFKVGNVKNDSLRKLFEDRVHSSGFIEFQNSDPVQLSQQYGDPHGESLDFFEGIRKKWFLRSIDPKHNKK
ncbi:MAG: radical SAM protein [bacterium]